MYYIDYWYNAKNHEKNTDIWETFIPKNIKILYKKPSGIPEGFGKIGFMISDLIYPP